MRSIWNCKKKKMGGESFPGGVIISSNESKK